MKALLVTLVAAGLALAGCTKATPEQPASALPLDLQSQPDATNAASDDEAWTPPEGQGPDPEASEAQRREAVYELLSGGPSAVELSEESEPGGF